MLSRRLLIKGALAAAGASFAGTRVWAAKPAAKGVVKATAITKVFGDGQKLVGIAVEYAKPVRAAGVSKDSFKVDGRTITAVAVSTSTHMRDKADEGAFVLIDLSPEDIAASLKVSRRPGPPAGGSPPSGAPSGPPSGMGELGKPLPGGPMQSYKPAIASFVQIGRLVPASGKAWPTAKKAVVTSAVRNRGIDHFVQREFTDPRSGHNIKYNLFVPKDHKVGGAFPLVLFMHDASVTGDDPLLALKQGLGALIWASPADQAKRPCFVLAPQFNEIIANDASQTSQARETIVALLAALQKEYSIDPARLYCTGQSGGAMMTIALNIRYPKLFAASYIVAGQWSADLVKPMANNKLWIVVAEGDLKAFPGQNAITAALEKEGAKVARATWDGRWDAVAFSKAVDAVERQGANINYCVLSKGTVVPPGEADTGGSNHMNTWRIAYTIEGIRDWLFRQKA